MVNHKRLPSDNALPPRKSTRLATEAVASGDDSSGPSNTATPRPGGDDSPSKDSSKGKNLSGLALVQEVTKMVENKDNAELMILELMRRYSFDLPLLQKLLRRKSTQASSRLVDFHPTNCRCRK
jgi:hypothetical protein